MNELETFAKFTLENGGIWHELERTENVELYKTQTRRMNGRNYEYDSPVYQVFVRGKRVFASTNYRQAYARYKNALEDAKNGYD